MSNRDDIPKRPESLNSPNPPKKSLSSKESNGTEKTRACSKQKSNAKVGKTSNARKKSTATKKSDGGVEKESKQKPERKPSQFDRLIATARRDMEATRKALANVERTLSLGSNASTADISDRQQNKDTVADQQPQLNRNKCNDGDIEMNEIQPNTK